MVGVAIETLYEVTLTTIVWVMFVSFIIALLWRKHANAHTAPLLLSSALFLLFVGLGLFRAEIYSWQFHTSPLITSLNQTVTLSGVVIQAPERRAQTQQLTVKVGEDKLLVSTDRFADIRYGDRVAFTGTLEKPDAFETDYGRIFNYPGYLLAKGIEYRVSFAEVVVEERNQGNRIIAGLLATKNELQIGIESVIAEPASGLGEGLLLGEKRGLGKELEENFRRTGIVHIVVLSGYNVMLVVTFVMFLLSFFLPTRFRLLFGLLAIVAFALIVGLSATVVRASIMAGLLLVAQSLRRTYNVMRALLLAGFVMVLINPYLLVYDVGFQLSFMATLGLILALPYIEGKEEKASLLSIRGYVGATIATQIAVLPLLLYHIGQVSLVSVIVNVLVLPAVPLAMLFTFLAGVVALLSTVLALPFSFIATLLLKYIILMATWWGSLPFSSVLVPVISPMVLFLLYAILALSYWFINRKLQARDEVVILPDWTIEEEVVQQKTQETNLPRMFQ